LSSGNITKDAVYEAVAPDDFEAMLEVGRHETRSGAFDRIIAATHDHYWNPLDPAYLDFDTPFDMAGTPLVPEWLIGALHVPYISDSLADPARRTAFINTSVHHSFSSILHGEQGALNLSASLCHVLKDPGAQEYAANQTREEARHVTAFAKYIQVRWGRPMDCGPALKGLLTEIIAAPEVYKKVVGMQMLVEGLAMGVFATFYQNLADPLGRRLLQLVMTDEAFHHRFGKIWASRTIPRLDETEHAIIEDWALECFQHLLFNLVAPSQQRHIYEAFDIDPDRAMAGFRETMTDDKRRETLARSSNIFRVLIKTLLNTGIITERTRGFYANYVDIDALVGEGERMIGDDIADEGMAYLRNVNRRTGRVRAVETAVA
jgi:hypothetical protein